MSGKNSTISKVGHGRQVVLPKQVCEELGFREGDFVEVTRTKGGVLIKPRKPVEGDDVLSSADAKSLSRGLRQMKEGQTRAWEKIKNELER